MCEYVPGDLLKKLGDLHSFRITKKLRELRGKVRGLLAPEVELGKRLTYDCKNGTNLPGVLMAENSDIVEASDQAVRNAHLGAKTVLDFYKEILGLKSLDDKYMPIVSSVHYDRNYNNAYYSQGAMVYGDGDGKFFTNMTGSLDVIAHELAHCRTEKTANLAYFSQPGALNEAFSDIAGVTTQQWLKGETDPKTASFLIGDEITGPEFPGEALRTMKNEKAYSGDTQPKHMKNYNWTLGDNQGVHINSGIINHFYYLLCLELNEPSWKTPFLILNSTLLKLGKWSSFRDFSKKVKLSASEFGKLAEVEKCLKSVGL